MAVTYFFGERIPSYVCLSTDVVASKVTGINTIGSHVYFTDTGTEWIVKDDLTLVPFAQNTINGTSGSTLTTGLTPQTIITGSFVVGNSTTNPIVLGELNSLGITTGSNLTGTSMTFLVSTDNITYTPLYNKDSTEVSLTITAAARSYALDPATFYTWPYVKGRLGTSASAVLQQTVNSLVYFNAKKL
jgi:hypothetical protein